MDHQVFGQTARFERYTAAMLYHIACGVKLDSQRTEPFGKQIDSIYANPFKKRKHEPQTAQEIKDYLIQKLLA